MMAGRWFPRDAAAAAGMAAAAPAASPGRSAARAAGLARPWLGGFNLLPYRQRNARLARRRRVCEWLAATLAGCVGVGALAGWQAFEKAQLDAQRASLDHSLSRLAAPLAEHDGLLRAQRERRDNAARAARLSEPLFHLRDLLEALSFEPGDGVLLRQLRQREHETQLLAASRDHLASADWLKRLSAIRGVHAVELNELHLPAMRGGARIDDHASAPVEFGARLRWDDPVSKAVSKAAAKAASNATPAHAKKSEPSGGAR